jgi:hypothetical protein
LPKPICGDAAFDTDCGVERPAAGAYATVVERMESIGLREARRGESHVWKLRFRGLKVRAGVRAEKCKSASLATRSTLGGLECAKRAWCREGWCEGLPDGELGTGRKM